MSEREYMRRSHVNVDPGADPTFNTTRGQLSGPLSTNQVGDPISRWKSRMFSEGPLGVTNRAGIWVKYTMYWIAIAACAVFSHGLLSAAGTTSYGGELLWFVGALMSVIAAVASILQPVNRDEILHAFRHYTFGLCVIPATTIAAIIWALRGVISTATTNGDTMAGLLQFAIPTVFLCTLVIPPVVFVKLIAGFHTMNKSTMTDGELMAMVTRNDNLQR